MASKQSSTPRRCASRSASTHAMLYSRAGTRDRNASVTHSESAAPERLSYHQCPSRSCLSTQSDQPPAASGIRGPRPSTPASGEEREPNQPPPIAPPESPVGTAKTSSTATASSDGAMTAAEPNHSPITAGGGGQAGRPPPGGRGGPPPAPPP